MTEYQVLRLRKAAGRLARRLPFTARMVHGRRSRIRRQLLLSMPRGSRCAEIGVWRGAFSEVILEVVQPSELHLIDPWAFIPSDLPAWEGGVLATDQAAMDEVHDGVVRRFADRPEVVIHRATSTEAARDFAPESLDWVYIDGDHRYEFVRADLDHYLPLVKTSGFIAGDDYLKGVDQGLPVKTAVDEFVAEGHAELVSILDTQFILRKL